MKNLLTAVAIIVASTTFASAGATDNGLASQKSVGVETEMTQVGFNLAAFCKAVASIKHEQGSVAWNNAVNSCLNANQ